MECYTYHNLWHRIPSHFEVDLLQFCERAYWR